MGAGGKRVDRLVVGLHDYLDQAEAASKVGAAARPPPYVWRLYRLWKEWGVSPLELMEWPAMLIEAFQACDIVEAQRNLPLVE